MIELVILGMLIEGKMSGYDIKKVTEQTVGIFYKMSYGSLYPALKRLVQSEYVTEEETNDSKNKKYTASPMKGAAISYNGSVSLYSRINENI